MKSVHAHRFVLISTFIGVFCFILVFLSAARSGQAGSPPVVTFRDQDNVPITGTIRVLCFESLTAVSPFADFNIEVNTGTPVTPLPTPCSHLAALRLRHTQPAGKHEDPAYWIYSTSWAPGATQPTAASGTIMINDAWSLTLINMVVSIGWTPAPASTVTTPAQIRAALQSVSADLYDITEGQIAIGPVHIYTGGEHWDEADIRFLPANDKRPSAFVGGIVPDKLDYAGYLTNTTYTPATTYYGRLWDGRDAFDETNGQWTNPNAYRTITHEWVHYGLFLYDAYQDTDGNKGYCVCQNLPTGCHNDVPDASVMAYHYNQNTEFWHKDTQVSVDLFCYDTWQTHVHGGTDWDALGQWAQIQGLSLPPNVNPLRSPDHHLSFGPTLGLVAHLFATTPGHTAYLPMVRGGSGTAVSPPQEPIINVILDTTSPPTTTIPSQVYLLQGGSAAPSRILPLGRTTGDPVGDVLGELRLLDVYPNDTLRAYADQQGTTPSSRQRYTLFADVEPTSDITLSPNPWQFTLDHHFDLVENRVMTLTLALEDLTGTMSNPKVQLCSLDADVGCHPDWNQTMTPSAPSAWQAQFAPLPGHKELPRYLVARIIDADDNDVADELVQWLQVGGGVGPAHNDGMAPLLDDVVMVNVAQPMALAGDCNVVSYMPAANSNALNAPLPVGIEGLLGIPLDIDITLTEDLCPKWAPNQTATFPQSFTVLLNFGYSQDEVTRLGLNETTDLFLLHYAPGFGWFTTQQITENTDLNWIVSSIEEDGIYAIGWMP